jgi:hypothetical protein
LGYAPGQIFLVCCVWIEGEELKACTPVAGAQDIHADVVHNAKKPGLEIRISPECIYVLMHFDEGLLHDFLCLINGSHDPESQAINSILISTD